MPVPARSRVAFSAVVVALAALPVDAQAQKVDDGTDSAIGQVDAKAILALIRQNIENSADAKVTSLRRSGGSIVCGSVNVKNRDGLYLGERGFVVDLSDASFGRVPEGPELLNPRDAGFDEKERVRRLYFKMCVD